MQGFRAGVGSLGGHCSAVGSPDDQNPSAVHGVHVGRPHSWERPKVKLREKGVTAQAWKVMWRPVYF